MIMKFKYSIMLLLFVPILFSCSKQKRQPNVVVFLVDDMGSDEIACYASKFHETPNIDALAKRGMLFTQAHAAAALCSPSRAAIMTGCSPARLHLTDWIPGQGQINNKYLAPDWQTYIDHSRVLLPEAMKEQGYATCFLGKWHLIPLPKRTEERDIKRVAEIKAMYDEYMPENNGFDENFGGNHRGNQGWDYFYPKFHSFPNLQGKGKEGDNLTDVLTDCAVDFMERKKDEPFLVYLSYFVVHWPVIGKPEYAEKYRQKLADNPDADYYMKNPEKAAMVQSLDESVGRVLAKLKAIGQLENTLIIFTADNGSEGENYVRNFRACKEHPYEGGTRVPLILAGPRVQQGVCNVPTIGMDLYPTILSYIGAPLKPEEHKDGVDMMPVLTGSGSIKDRPLYWHYPNYNNYPPHSHALVDGWKVIRRPDSGTVELYHLDKDPMERNDLASKYPEKTEAMLKVLDACLADAYAQHVVPNPDYDPDPSKYSGGARAYKAWKKENSEKEVNRK
jgi:arylsulfatase A